MVRDPVVAGQFYPGKRESLVRELKKLSVAADVQVDALGVVSPHAGYPYSGAVAGATFAAIRPRPVYIILGPNHTGLGQSFGITEADSWKTPLGEVRIDTALAGKMVDGSKYMRYDDLSHAREHSIEVQLPFLQSLQGEFKFVPMVVSDAPLAVYREIGFELVRAIKGLKLEKKITIIASSDMTHYEPQGDAQKKDDLAIKAILELDEDKLVDRVEKYGISMCGYAPCAIMLSAAKELGANTARLVKYRTSGDATGDYSSVVGYAGIIIT